MIEFPTNKLRPRFATLFMGSLDKPAMEFHFEAFSVEDHFEEEVWTLNFDRPVRADFIELPSFDPNELLGQVFDFPLNPVDGYIDASVYFNDRHNMIDISKLKFDASNDGYIEVTVVSHWLMTLEGSASNDFDYTFTMPLQT